LRKNLIYSPNKRSYDENVPKNLGGIIDDILLNSAHGRIS